MPNYQFVGNKKSEPSRRNRKSSRNTTFIYNKKLAKKLKREKRQLQEEG